MPADDPLSSIQYLNEREERSRSPLWQYAKDAIALIGAVVPAAGMFLGAIENSLDRREAANRAELISTLVDEVQRHAKALASFLAANEANAHFLRDEFPGLVVEAVRRAETVRSTERIHRFASILRHSLELGPTDGADYVEEMLRIAVELSDADVRMLDAAQTEFDRQRAETPASENQIATIAWLQARSGVTDSDERASIGAKLQSFGLVSRLQTNGPNPAYKVLRRGKRFLEYVRTAE